MQRCVKISKQSVKNFRGFNILEQTNIYIFIIVDFCVLPLLIAQKIGQTFWNLIKKNQLAVSNGSGVIHFLMKPWKNMTDQKR
jgi:hypothetical protein